METGSATPISQQATPTWQTALASIFLWHAKFHACLTADSNRLGPKQSGWGLLPTRALTPRRTIADNSHGISRSPDYL